MGMLSVACASDSNDRTDDMSAVDGSEDAGDGSGTNGGASAGTNGGASAGTNGGASAGTNGGATAGSTTGATGGTSDAGATGGGATAGNDPGAAAGVVTCGDTSCSTPDICCVSFLGGMNGGFECKAKDACTGFTSAPGTCDGKEDCSGDQACCAKFSLQGGSGAFCEASCMGEAQALCHSDADCEGGKTCIACAPPTGGIVALVYHLCSATPMCPSPYMNAP